MRFESLGIGEQNGKNVDNRMETEGHLGALGHTCSKQRMKEWISIVPGIYIGVYKGLRRVIKPQTLAREP